MNINPLDVPGTMFEIELLNPNPSSRRGKDGPIRRISFEVSKEVYEAFMDAAESNLRLIGKLAVAPDTDEQPAHDAVNGKPKKGRKPKEPKGPYSYFWEYVHNSGFLTFPNVAEALEAIRETPYEDAWKDLLHRFFGVGGGTLTVVAPAQVLANFPAEENPQVALLVERARKFQQDKEANKQ